MSDIQKFRKSMNGFNRHDVVTYIEYLNNKYRSEVNQLQNRLQAATRPVEDHGLAEKCAALEAENQALKQELEAYRRAERAERLAMERAQATSRQAKGILADATAQIQISAAQLEEAAKTMAAHMDVYKTAVLSAGNILNSAAASLGTVCPEE